MERRHVVAAKVINLSELQQSRENTGGIDKPWFYLSLYMTESRIFF